MELKDNFSLIGSFLNFLTFNSCKIRIKHDKFEKDITRKIIIVRYE